MIKPLKLTLRLKIKMQNISKRYEDLNYLIKILELNK